MIDKQDFPIFIDPPQILSQNLARRDLREALRLAKKRGVLQDDTEAFLYVADQAFFLEAGNYRRRFAGESDWDGCVSLNANLLVGYWNALPKGETVSLKYERGWLSIGSLSLGRAVWQPKYDPNWMAS